MLFSCFLLLFALDFLSAGRVPQPEERIIGGSSIEIEEAPWQVSLQYQGRHYCGGSIYSRDIIITAAHCRFMQGRRLEAEDFEIRVGSALSGSGGKLIKVAAIKSWEPYVNNSATGDIAVMRLSEPLEFNNKVQTIPLAEKNPAAGSPAFLSGWGATTEPYFMNYMYPSDLQGIRLQIYLPIFAEKLFPSLQNVVYAGSFGQTSCSGDSGGPLVVNQQLVGVVSGGPQYCDGYSEFASVPYFRDWILNAIKSLS
ncbi:trypsin alpha-like [Drosophila subpulchrella]|uniref:trypsin alpha-like n=1 Tax=Drosophila subpulchrella TaxID=1486046 RepID=UPI0018A1B172|nr:trypsin alpha-like [Drosophila subpulchrella]